MLKSKISKLDKRGTNSALAKDKRRRKKAIRCSFKVVPYAPKYVYPHDFYLFYCDLPLITQEGSMRAEISLFNKFKIMKNAIIEQSNIKQVRVSLENNQYLHIPHWSYEIERIENTEGPEMETWANKLRLFCEKYEEIMRGYESITKNAKPEQQKLLVEMNEITQEKVEKIKENHACVHFKLRLKDHNFHIEEIAVTEDFLREIGYTTETFVTTVLNEGLPQLTNFDDEVNLIPIKLVMENYLSFEKEGFQSPETNTKLMMKSGYVKKAKNKVYVMINYQNSNIGIDVLSTLYDMEDPVLDQTLIPKHEMNTQFLNHMMKREQEMSAFLKHFYNETIPLRYTFHDKICGIRELPVINTEGIY